MSINNETKNKGVSIKNNPNDENFSSDENIFTNFMNVIANQAIGNKIIS